LFLTEVASPRSRLAHLLEVVLDMLQGVPTVVVGIVVFGLIVVPQSKETGFAGAIALAIIMLPLIARASQQVLAVVPPSFRDAADALGVDRWRTVIFVILPAAAGGILTGAILAVARAAGETAPLLLVDNLYHPNAIQLQPFGNGMPSVPMFIYTTYDLPSLSGITLAWGAALVLLTGILVANIGARLMLARTRRRMGL
ncbi:MAG: PstA family ABC transporter permease, partial [Solirubrobacteraceae bacterium]